MVEHMFSNGEGNAIGWVFDMMESLPHERFTRRGAKRSTRIFSKVRYQRMGSYLEELKMLAKPYLALFKRTQGQHKTDGFPLHLTLQSSTLMWLLQGQGIQECLEPYAVITMVYI
jgi:hypothetical protein